MFFKYCSFYGLSAPLMLLFNKKEIDSLFAYGMSGSVTPLLMQLRFEVKYLKELLSDKKAIGYSEDNSLGDVDDFIRWLSYQLDKKESSREYSMVSGTETTNRFGVEKSELDEIAMILEGSTNYFAQPFKTVAKDIPSDYVPRFRNLLDVKRWMISEMKTKLTSAEQASVNNQMQSIRKSPSGKVVIDGKQKDLTVESPASLAFLKSITQLANSKVDGISLIDYILMKIESVLEKDSVYGAILLGTSFPVIKSISSIQGANYMNTSLVSGPLNTANRTNKMQIINSFLNDCDAMLTGEAQDINATLTIKESSSVDQIVRSVLSSAAFIEAGLSDSEEELSELIAFLRDNVILTRFIGNYRELIFLTRLLVKAKQLEQGGAVLGWGLQDFVNDQTTLDDIGIEIAETLGIGGVYCDYKSQIFDTIKNTSRVFIQDNFKLNPVKDKIVYDNTVLLKRYLLSIKERSK